MMDLENLLNPGQLAAVRNTEGASVIVAGAGSGKTRVLTYRIAHMIEQGVLPFEILALTFTNKAAREMRERIMQVVGVGASRQIWMGTFHSVFSRILRAEAEAIGFTSNFTIYDQSDSKSLVKHIIKEMGLDEKVYGAGPVQNRISNLKNQMVLPSDYYSNKNLRHDDEVHKMGAFADIFSRYCIRCRECNAMDFDDLLVYTAELFRQYPEVLRRYQQRFRYILVDEYQDTNGVQHRIVTMLASAHGNICVVGDDAQSIYSFRGAKIDNILSFKNEFRDCSIFKLEQNYRSTQNIVNAANSLIDKNRRQIRKNLFSIRPEGDKIEVVDSISDTEEASQVSSEINALLLRRVAEPDDIAILYRSHSQSRVIEEALRKRAIPYKIYGGISFYQRKEIKDVLAYLRLVVNPSDEEALRRVINVPARGIGDTTIGRLFDIVAQDRSVPALGVLASIDCYETKINRPTQQKLKNFAAMISHFVEENQTSDAFSMVQSVISKSGILDDVQSDNSTENLARRDNLQEFVNAVREFCDDKVNRGDNEVALVNFLNEVALITDQDSEDGERLHAVTLMTVHAAKGLEFPYVFIVGVEENLFPSMMSETEKDIEEERRLMYVAITRAKERCTISYAKSRYRYGQFQFSNPSRFLHDIDPRYLRFSASNTTFRPATFANPYERGGGANPFSFEKKPDIIKNPPQPKRAMRPVSSVMRDNPTPSVVAGGERNVAVGDRVAHSAFGEGVVVAVDGAGDNRKATVEFDKFGAKQLLLKFARITKI